MKLINYNYGYVSEFACSIHGKIIMTKQEFDKAVKYLLHPKVKNCYFGDYGLPKTMFKQDLNRTIPTRNGSYLLNIRVGATELLARKFELKNYKRANYMLEVVLN